MTKQSNFNFLLSSHNLVYNFMCIFILARFVFQLERGSQEGRGSTSALGEQQQEQEQEQEAKNQQGGCHLLGHNCRISLDRGFGVVRRCCQGLKSQENSPQGHYALCSSRLRTRAGLQGQKCHYPWGRSLS